MSADMFWVVSAFVHDNLTEIIVGIILLWVVFEWTENTPKGNGCPVCRHSDGYHAMECSEKFK